MRVPQLPAWLQFAVCVVVWGGSWIAIQAAVDDADPIGVAAYRTLLAVPLLIAVAAALRLSRPRLTDAMRGMLIGTVFIGANFALVYWSAPRLPVGFAALIYATTPIQAAILSLLFARRERFTLRRAAALLLGPLGIAIAFDGFSARDAAPMFATLMVLLAAGTSAAGTVMARRWSHMHPVWTNVFANLSGSALLWILYSLNPSAPATPQSRAGWMGFLYMLLGGSVLAFALYFMLVRAWDASRASFTTLTTPFVALLAGFAILHEPIHASDLVGAGVVLLAGMLLLSPRREPLPIATRQPAANAIDLP